MSVYDKMTAIANPLRNLSGETDKLTLDDMAEHVEGVVAEVDEQTILIDQITTILANKSAVVAPEIELQSKTVSPSTSNQTITPDENYDGLSSVVVEAMPTAEQAVPSVSVNSAGLVTATAEQSAGYVEAGTKSGTLQLSTQVGKTVTPGTAQKSAVSAGKYTTGTVYVNGDANLVAGNIKSGVSIFGVSGSYTGTSGTYQSKTVSPSTSKQTVTPDSGYDALSQVTVNAMTTATQATPSITVSTAGLITASATQTAGYVSAGTKSATKQLTTQGAQTITPGTSNKTIASGTYLTGTQTIKGDTNLKADNIKSGVSIFGVTGTMEGANLTPLNGISLNFSAGNDVTIDPGIYDGFSSVTIAYDKDLVASNVKSGVEIMGVTGTYTGSGSSSDISPLTAIDVIEWTPATDTKATDGSPSVNHALGVVPDGFFVVPSESHTSDSTNSVLSIGFNAITYGNYYFSRGLTNSTGGWGSVSYQKATLSSYCTASKVYLCTSSTDVYFRAGITYHVIVFKR